MTSETLQQVLGWCTLINFAILMVWFLMFLLAHGFMYRKHAAMFRMSVETFDALHYGLIGGYKLLIIVFNLVPYLALHLAK